MTYAQMIDLIGKARKAGSEHEYANQILHEAFDLWLNDEGIQELTDEEESALCVAFEEGFGIK